ncbi:MAG: serine/threonine protein kinase, partial [Planctomycetales bacterium]
MSTISTQEVGGVALSMAQLFEYLSTYDLVSEEDIQHLKSQVNNDETDQDGGGLIIRLVQEGKLSDFQAACLREDRPDKLTIDGYRLLRSVGKGGMAEVYEAVRVADNTVVALKLLDKKIAKRKESTYRFDREVQASAKLSHPNIVRALDSSIDGEDAYLVMEFVEGSDLAAFVAEHGPLPVEEAVAYVLHAAIGLEYAHSQRIVHRDIKPHNLLLNYDGMVKILDMGLVRFDHAPKLGKREDSRDRLTKMGVMLGT